MAQTRPHEHIIEPDSNLDPTTLAFVERCQQEAMYFQELIAAENPKASDDLISDYIILAFVVSADELRKVFSPVHQQQSPSIAPTVDLPPAPLFFGISLNLCDLEPSEQPRFLRNVDLYLKRKNNEWGLPNLDVHELREALIHFAHASEPEIAEISISARNYIVATSYSTCILAQDILAKLEQKPPSKDRPITHYLFTHAKVLVQRAHDFWHRPTSIDSSPDYRADINSIRHNNG